MFMKKVKTGINILLIFFLISCAEFKNKKIELFVKKNNVNSGEQVDILYNTTLNYIEVEGFLKNKNNGFIYETYGIQKFKEKYTISRIINKKIKKNSNLEILLRFYNNEEYDSKSIDISINPSIIVESFCGSQDCKTLSGNVLEKIKNKLQIRIHNFLAYKIEYNFFIGNDSFNIYHEFNSPVLDDWVDNIRFNEIKKEYSSNIAYVKIKAYNTENEYIETLLPFKIVRPIEIKHYGKYELAETYEPKPVTGCIPGSLGNNVQYSESESETRQNSYSITYNKNWSNSISNNLSETNTEGISVSTTDSTINSSSLSESETNSEGFTNTNSEGNSSNYAINFTDGENWSWNMSESDSTSTSTSNTNNNNTTASGSVTTGVSGEGSLPFLAKASGKVEVTAGISRSFGESNTNSEQSANSNSRGYTTGGTKNQGRVYGSTQNDSRSYSLNGSYILSNSTSSTISESNSQSSGRVWNMSESFSSGKVVSVGNSESIGQTIITSNNSSTTFSYSGYIPRGRYGIFFRQTSRYIKLSEIINYNLNGFPAHAGFIMMNNWAWAPELSIGEDCSNMPNPNLPKAECYILPCN